MAVGGGVYINMDNPHQTPEGTLNWSRDKLRELPEEFTSMFDFLDGHLLQAVSPFSSRLATFLKALMSRGVCHTLVQDSGVKQDLNSAAAPFKVTN